MDLDKVANLDRGKRSLNPESIAVKLKNWRVVNSFVLLEAFHFSDELLEDTE
jgi:hypothetical protein